MSESWWNSYGSTSHVSPYKGKRNLTAAFVAGRLSKNRMRFLMEKRGPSVTVTVNLQLRLRSKHHCRKTPKNPARGEGHGEKGIVG